MATNSKRLSRDVDNRMIAGVCSGLAAYFDLDITLVRVLYVLISLFSAAFPGFIVYIILWVVMPEK